MRNHYYYEDFSPGFASAEPVFREFFLNNADTVSFCLASIKGRVNNKQLEYCLGDIMNSTGPIPFMVQMESLLKNEKGLGYSCLLTKEIKEVLSKGTLFLDDGDFRGEFKSKPCGVFIRKTEYEYKFLNSLEFYILDQPLGYFNGMDHRIDVFLNEEDKKYFDNAGIALKLQPSCGCCKC